ncbi:hypothetical protein [Amycolatopsis jejuensis]|uniref:hypothetical protein n=1 Tax=Amycolatopsis jejuensis TaxID=330084 RepID=UPI000AD64AD9|nr:hypothetical protein [Amycolatopsis jejuensis]
MRLGDSGVEVLGVCSGAIGIGDPVAVVPRAVHSDDDHATAYGFEKVAGDA